MKDRISVPGFKVGGKKGKKYGVAIAFSEVDAACSLMVTSNRIRAAPLELSVGHAMDRSARAVVISSGNANAFTGEVGKRDAIKMAELLSGHLGLEKNEIIVNSTGIIGQRLEMDMIEDLINGVAKDIRIDDSGVMNAAKAMMTTDSIEKVSSRSVVVDGKKVRITGVVKGAGMIAPKLMHATMIAVIMTDAHIPRDRIDAMLGEAVEGSFNLAIVDGDTSTNDMVVLLANGKAGNDSVDQKLQGALNEVCLDLARMIVMDGEGATKLFNIEIKGAASKDDAKKAARAVAGSTLVKTALFGENPNWGRVIAAIGYSGAEFDREKLSLWLRNEKDEVVLVKNGKGVALKGTKEIKRAGEILKSREVTYTAELGIGGYDGEAFGCDLGYSYVKVNAEYTT